jgi:glycosyltransferase involved in cell wall biosynthesis
MDLINEVREYRDRSANSPPKIIWVGNSKWGKRFGFKDHKGMESLVVPLLTLNRQKGNPFEFEIIDSSKKRLTQREVLHRIRSADILIHTSKSEGTGLPILEALGLGTNVVTTAVGIATEISARFVTQNIAEPTPEDFFNQLQILLKSKLVHSQNLRSDYLGYIKQAESEDLNGIVVRKLRFPKTHQIISFKANLMWVYRNRRS